MNACAINWPPKVRDRFCGMSPRVDVVPERVQLQNRQQFLKSDVADECTCSLASGRSPRSGGCGSGWSSFIVPGGAPATMITVPALETAHRQHLVIHLSDHRRRRCCPCVRRRTSPRPRSAPAGCGSPVRSRTPAAAGGWSQASRRTVSPDEVKATSAFASSRSPISRAA